MSDTTLSPADQLKALLAQAAALQAEISAQTPATISTSPEVNLQLASSQPEVLQAQITPIPVGSDETAVSTQTMHAIPPSSGPMLTLAEAVPSLPADFDAAAAAAEQIAKATGLSDDIPGQIVNIVSRIESLEKYLPLLQALEKAGVQVVTDVEAQLPPGFVTKVNAFFAKHFPQL